MRVSNLLEEEEEIYCRHDVQESNVLVVNLIVTGWLR